MMEYQFLKNSSTMEEADDIKTLKPENNDYYCIAHTEIQDRLRVYGTDSGRIDAKCCEESRVHTGFNKPSSPQAKKVQQRNDIAFKNAMTFGTGYMLDNFDEKIEEMEKAKQNDATQEHPQVSDNNQPAPLGTLSADFPEINNAPSESSLEPEMKDMFPKPEQQDRFTFADADSSYTSEEAQGHRR